MVCFAGAVRGIRQGEGSGEGKPVPPPPIVGESGAKILVCLQALNISPLGLGIPDQERVVFHSAL